MDREQRKDEVGDDGHGAESVGHIHDDRETDALALHLRIAEALPPVIHWRALENGKKRKHYAKCQIDAHGDPHNPVMDAVRRDAK